MIGKRRTSGRNLPSLFQYSVSSVTFLFFFSLVFPPLFLFLPILFFFTAFICLRSIRSIEFPSSADVFLFAIPRGPPA
ncbi:MAG: hypothetical protein ABIK95_03645 [Acidobacteriota bacterium]